MAFADVIQQDGAGAAWLLDISFDDFATVSYRWSTISILVGSDQYEARIAEKGLSKITRGFGREATPQAGTVSLLLDNTDLGADWLVDRATVASQVFRARFKLTLAVYPNGDPASYQTKVMGTYQCLDFPQRDDRSVSLQLSDDLMGIFDQPLTSPTVRDWADDAGSTVTNCPIVSDYQPVPSPDLDWDTPLPVVFGSGRLNCFPADAEHASDGVGGSNVGAMDGCRAIVVCATTSPDNVNANDVQALWGIYRNDVMLGTQPWADGANKNIGIPKTFTVQQNPPLRLRQYAGQTLTIWEPVKTQTLTKDGASWRLLWVKFNVEAYATWWSLAHIKDSAVWTETKLADGTTSTEISALNVPQAPQTLNTFGTNARFAAFAYFQVSGRPYSGRTNLTSNEQLGVDVIRDLICYYSKAGTDGFDLARYGTARQMNPAPVSGIIQPQRPISQTFKFSKTVPPSNALSAGQLRQALSDICQSADIDLALTWDGKVGLFSSYFNFTDLTATRLAIDETRVANVVERIPSRGERWAPYNRVNVVAPDGSVHGPFDNPDATIDWGVTLERTVQSKWGRPFQTSDPIYSNMIWYSYRQLESVVRPIISFVTDREALQLDLGDLFDFTWTRGGSSGPYTAAVFRVESMTVDPETLQVQIDAVWVDDIGDGAYLLDDESFLFVADQDTIPHVPNVIDGDDLINFGKGAGLNTAGILAGDILVLLDATQADNVFSRYRCLRIISVGAAELQVFDPDLDFDAPFPGTTVAFWEIRRGKTTYPDSVIDPTHYPSDGDMYGKACSDDELYSDTTDANRLG